MSGLEKEKIAEANIRGWQHTAPDQLVEELASLSQETHRIPDPYSYSVTAKGELLSLTANCLVKDTIDDKTSPLGQLEYQAVLVTEDWAAKSNNGVSIWLSPPCPGVYDKAAFVVYEIEYQNGFKTLFNRKIILDDFSEADCMKFAWNLTSFSRNKPIFRNSDEIRATPLILDTKDKSWIDILEKLIDAPEVWAMIRNGEDKQHKKEALRQATEVQKQFFANNRVLIEASGQFDYYGGRFVYSDEAKMAIMQMLGNHSGSCPPRSSSGSGTAFQTVAGSAVAISTSGGFVESDQYGSLEFECPNPECKKINKRPRGRLIPNCQYCQANVRC